MLFEMKRPLAGSLKLASPEPDSSQPKCLGQHQPPFHRQPKQA
jgi:hypothetical protein